MAKWGQVSTLYRVGAMQDHSLLCLAILALYLFCLSLGDLHCIATRNNEHIKYSCHGIDISCDGDPQHMYICWCIPLRKDVTFLELHNAMMVDHSCKISGACQSITH